VSDIKKLFMGKERQIWLYDTTLRDGSQMEGISLSLEDKLKIALTLDEMGITFIEGGWPGANPKDEQFFAKAKEINIKNSEIVAFCSTRRPGRRPQDEPLLQSILAAETTWVTIFGKSWDLHVTEGIGTTLEENLDMISSSIEYLISQGKRVIYDAEHWFDGYFHNPQYAISTLQAAQQAGAQWLVLCDTNGGTLPEQITQSIKQLREQLGDSLALGIHTHNDSGLAVANALAGVLEGVEMIQGTINGYGERCGNANLCTLIPNLQLKMGYYCLEDRQLAQLSPNSHLISEIVNLAPDDHAPFVGSSAFAHKGGIHVSAVQKNPITYEHIDLNKVGNKRKIVISEQAGISNILSKARTFGLTLEKEDKAARIILDKLKLLESQGYQFEAAEASFELLMLDALGKRKELFELKGFQIHCDLLTPSSRSLATIKLSVNGKDILEVGEGNGPVSALDQALRKALLAFYPSLAEFYLTDYKVRILDSGSGTDAKTRVLVESSNRRQRWSTVGVSANILEASYKATVEAVEYGLLLNDRNTF